jgi:hypothetical protein
MSEYEMWFDDMSARSEMLLARDPYAAGFDDPGWPTEDDECDGDLYDFDDES